MRVTRFPARAENISDRMSGFMSHLRLNGLNVGVAETEAALEAMTTINALDANETCLALKMICATDADRYSQFDELFRSFWFNDGREQQKHKSSESPRQKNRWTNRSLFDAGRKSNGSGAQDVPDNDEDGEATQSTDGKLISSRIKNVNKADLREFMKPEDLAHAEKVAQQIARSIRDRRSRRRKASYRGSSLDLRKMARKSISYGGEPLKLLKRKRPERPVHLVALLDVSGSMVAYSRVFLAFLKGLVSADQKTDAYLFHTQLVRISDALRDGDTFRAVNRLSMMAQGFGGGTKIAKNLELFNQQYASQSIGNRSVVIILSDGYDTDPPENLANALAKLKKKGCKIIWLNPLKGWKDYEPVARGMQAALPFLDLFAAANTLDSLAELEPHLETV
ncbi:MAG: VWA domain-containing protein [Pseudomonadota bacterium]